MGDQLIPGAEDEQLPTEEASARPRWLSSSVMTIAVVVFVAAIIAVLVAVFLVDHARDSRSAQIDNAPSASASASSSPSPTQTPPPSSPPVHIGEVTDALQQCLNRATDYTDISAVSTDCFLDYTVHLPQIYGLRDIGEVTVNKVEVTEAQTAKIKAQVRIGDQDAGSVDAYWVQRTGQFKIVGVSLSDWADQQMREDVVKQVENQE